MLLSEKCRSFSSKFLRVHLKILSCWTEVCKNTVDVYFQSAASALLNLVLQIFFREAAICSLKIPNAYLHPWLISVSFNCITFNKLTTTTVLKWLLKGYELASVGRLQSLECNSFLWAQKMPSVQKKVSLPHSVSCPITNLEWVKCRISGALPNTLLNWTLRQAQM